MREKLTKRDVEKIEQEIEHRKLVVAQRSHRGGEGSQGPGRSQREF